MFFYYQQNGGEEVWQPVPASQRDSIEAGGPVFITALSVSKLVEDLSHEDKLKLAYAGPFYCDWDSEDETVVIGKVQEFLDKLEDLGVNLEMCKLYATGNRGYHLEVPPEMFMEKVPKSGTVGLPMIYREMALNLIVDTLDMRVYSAGRGRMWRVPNVERSNGRYKVRLTPEEMREMTPELCQALTSEPREPWTPKLPEFCVKLSIEFTRAQQKVEELLKKRARYKPDPLLREKASCYSVQMAMSGLGIKEGVGFQNISLQLACAANAAGMSEDLFVIECADLITSHKSDGSRYNSDARRAEELRRMWRYTHGNPCYEFSIGAMKSILTHSAPDLDGITASKEDVKQVIEEAALEDPEIVDEYGDVARGVTIAKFGIYVDTEGVKKRVCAISFANAAILKSADASQIVGYDADVLVNGVYHGRCTLETEIFSGLMPFNRFLLKYGHAFQGSDAHVRMVMMRFVESAKKKGNISYVVNREGLDIVSIPQHPNPDLHTPFMVWADANGVVTEPRIAETGVVLKFASFPDPRGVFRTDIAAAPDLAEWAQSKDNVQELRETLRNLMTCQRAEVLGKLLGWYTACFWKQLFQRHYGKFPLLHVNGPAGMGKTEMSIAISSMFFYHNESRPLSPGSSNFALGQHLSLSSSIPLIVDEYKPHEMAKNRHDAIKLLFRDAYNQRDVAKGGGTRESDDYRMLQMTQYAAPLAFIAEAAEDEAAVMERVVLVTLARPPQSQGLKNLARFQAFRRNKHLLGIMGKYMAASILNESTKESFMDEFDALYKVAQRQYMLTEEDLAGDMTTDAMVDKQQAKERPVFNHTVAKFGFQQFRKLVNAIVGYGLDDLMGELEDGIYSRLSDMNAATTPEYVKVLKQISAMSYDVEKDRPDAIRKSIEYALTEDGGRSLVELAVNNAYMRYRVYCRSANTAPLFQGAEAFAHAIKDSPAFVKRGSGKVLDAPNTFTFDAAELARLGVDIFKN